MQSCQKEEEEEEEEEEGGGGKKTKLVYLTHKLKNKKPYGNLNKCIKEFPLWFSQLRTQHSVHDDEGSIPGQCIKHLALLQGAA